MVTKHQISRKFDINSFETNLCKKKDFCSSQTAADHPARFTSYWWYDLSIDGIAKERKKKEKKKRFVFFERNVTEHTADLFKAISSIVLCRNQTIFFPFLEVLPSNYSND